MRTRVKHGAVVALLISTAFVLQGCSDSDEEDSGGIAKQKDAHKMESLDGADEDGRDKKDAMDRVPDATRTKATAHEKPWGFDSRDSSSRGGPLKEIKLVNDSDRGGDPAPGVGGRLLEHERAYERALMSGSGAGREAHMMVAEQHLREYYKHTSTTTTTAAATTTTTRTSTEATSTDEGTDSSARPSKHSTNPSKPVANKDSTVQKTAEAASVPEAISSTTQAGETTTAAPKAAAKVGERNASNATVNVSDLPPVVVEELKIEKSKKLAPQESKQKMLAQGGSQSKMTEVRVAAEDEVNDADNATTAADAADNASAATSTSANTLDTAKGGDSVTGPATDAAEAASTSTGPKANSSAESADVEEEQVQEEAEAAQRAIEKEMEQQMVSPDGEDSLSANATNLTEAAGSAAPTTTLLSEAVETATPTTTFSSEAADRIAPTTATLPTKTASEELSEEHATDAERTTTLEKQENSEDESFEESEEDAEEDPDAHWSDTQSVMELQDEPVHGEVSSAASELDSEAARAARQRLQQQNQALLELQLRQDKQLDRLRRQLQRHEDRELDLLRDRQHHELQLERLRLEAAASRDMPAVMLEMDQEHAHGRHKHGSRKMGHWLQEIAEDSKL
mmetsp:Transcript_14585/g.34580  ORF Transcript_14585/g.34580 Transcript_14585/m.34580 type:complete len:626 (+) Transcript_14585:110-1987(+)